MTDTTVTFRRYWRGREPGQVVSTLDYGVAQLLVQRGIAAWGRPKAPAAEVGPTAESPAPPPARTRARRSV